MSNVVRLPVKVVRRTCPGCNKPLERSVMYYGRFFCTKCNLYPATQEPEADAAFRRFRGEDR